MNQKPSDLFEPDIVQRVRDKFGADADAVMEQLLQFCRASPDLAEPRIVRCIVHAAQDLSGIAHYISMAQSDFRDLIMAVEFRTHPGTKSWQGIKDQIYDFHFSFSDERNSTTENVSSTT